MTTSTPVKVLYQETYYDARITRNWGDGVYEVRYENEAWGKDTVDQSRIMFLQEVEIFFEGDYYGAKMKNDHGNGTYDVIYDNAEFGEEAVDASRIRWTKGPPSFAGHDSLVGAPGSTQESTAGASNSTRSSASVIGQRVQVKYGEDFYTAIIKECHVDEMYLVQYDDSSFGEEIVDTSAIKWDLVGVKVEVLFAGKYYQATITTELAERGYLVEYVLDYGVEAVTVDRIQWITRSQSATKPLKQDPTQSEKPRRKRSVGAKVNVWFEGKLYGASIKDVPSETTFLIVYDEKEYGEEIVEAPRVVWPKQQPRQPTTTEKPPTPSTTPRPISYDVAGVSTRGPRKQDPDVIARFLWTQEQLIQRTKENQKLQEKINRLKKLPKPYLESLDTSVQERILFDLNEIMKQKRTCGICLSRPKTHLFLPCQHRACYDCSSHTNVCQLCRTPVSDVVNIVA